MARISFSGHQELIRQIEQISQRTAPVFKSAVYAGAGVVADRIRQSLNRLPEEEYRYLREGEAFSGVPTPQKKDLLDSFGVTPIDVDKNGVVNAKVGFSGYGSHPTKKYPKGLPNQLLARAIESGSSVRRASPFVRPAVNRARRPARDAMETALKRGLEKAKGA